MKHRISAITLRGATLVIRFGLSLLVARNLDIEQTGLFFLYLAGVQIASSILPMDIYAFTTRALLQNHPSQKLLSQTILERHFGSIVLISVVFSPLAAAIFYLSSPSVGLTLAVLFVAHSGMEALSNDIGRLMVPLSRPLLSAAYLFVRSAIWIIPAAILLESKLWTTDALGLILFWFASSFAVTIIGTLAISRAIGSRVSILIDYRWVYLALRQSLVFLIGSIAFRFVIGGDRFLVERALGLEAVAVYGFYASLAIGLLALVETGSSAWNYPSLVKAIQSRDKDRVYRVFFPYLLQNTLASFALSAILVLGFSLLPDGTIDTVYLRNVETLHLVSLGVLSLCISLPFHYTIYGFGHDAFRLISMVIGMVIMVIAWSAFLPQSGLQGAGLMLALALGAVALIRVIGGFWLLITMRHWQHENSL